MIKVGLLVDNAFVPRWVHEFVVSLSANPEVKIEAIIINDSSKSSKQGFDSFVYRVMRNIDRKLMPYKYNPFKRIELDLKLAPLIRVRPIQTKYSDKFPPEIIDQIKRHDIDIMLRFGFRILRGEILTVAKYGIISLHHGDTQTYRGGPPAFWEVVNKEPVTAVTVQQLTENLDGGNILGKSFLRTDSNSFYRNQAKLYWAGKELLLYTIGQIVLVGPIKYFEKQTNKESHFYSYPLYKNPGNLVSLKIFLNWLWNNLSRKVERFFFVNQWQLVYAYGKEMETALYRYKSILPPKDRIWADPFVAKSKDGYVVFFEEKLNSEANAHISCILFNEKGVPDINSVKTVLTETHHLSYPFVFFVNDVAYMMPESAAINELNLYKAISFPHTWEKKTVLLSGIKIYDATLHFHEGNWYLFCNAKKDNSLSSDVYLHIYYSSDIFSEPFKEHPLNPVYRDVRLSRPAGKIFTLNGELIRPSQVSAPNYGNAIQLNKITRLSTTEFTEEKMECITTDWDNSISCVHTINNEGLLTIADIQKKRFRW